jgi:hypothetical protein
MNYVVKYKTTVFGEFDTYEEAIALYRKLVTKHPAIVIQDNTRR